MAKIAKNAKNAKNAMRRGMHQPPANGFQILAILPILAFLALN